MKNIFPRLSRITLEEWLKYHPYDKEVSSDHYYIGLSNDIQHEIFHIDINGNLVSVDYKYLSCMLVCYFEDIVSQTGIWTTFINETHKLYGKYLPFYDTAEYEYGEINLADIRFIIWHFCSNIAAQNHLVDPYSLENEEMARIVSSLLNEQAGQAPRNEDLKKKLTLASNADIYQVKELMDFFFFGSYLNHYYTNTLLEEAILNIKNQKGFRKQDLEVLEYDKRINLLFNAFSPLLAQRSNEVLACWVGESHPQYENLMSLSKLKRGIYLYKGSNSIHMQMEHIATGKQLNVNITLGLQLSASFVPDKTIMEMAFVEWNNEWWMIEAAFLVNESKTAKPSAREKSLFASVASQLGIVRRQEECFLETTNNERLTFFKDKRSIFTFIDDVWDLYHFRFGHECMDRKLFDVHGVTFGVDDDLENVVVFFNSNAGMEFYPEIAQCISASNNPDFDPDTETDIEELLLNENYSSAFVSYLIENRMIEIEPLSGEGGFQYVWTDCDFLLRYWKKEDYTVEPKLFVE